MLDGRTRSSGAATQDPCDQGGFLVQFKPFFGADEILAKDRAELWVEVFGTAPGNLLKRMVGLGGLEPPTSPLSGARPGN
jgi:hypothetical protein